MNLHKNPELFEKLILLTAEDKKSKQVLLRRRAL